MPAAPKYRVCTFCKHRKPLADFGRNKHAKGGLHYYCKVCAALKRKAWYITNKPKALASSAAWKARTAAVNTDRNPYDEEAAAA